MLQNKLEEAKLDNVTKKYKMVGFYFFETLTKNQDIRLSTPDKTKSKLNLVTSSLLTGAIL